MLFCISFASVFSVLLVMAPAALSGTHTMTTQENLLPCKTHDQECSQHSPTIQKHLKEVCQSRNTYGWAAPIITPRNPCRAAVVCAMGGAGSAVNLRECAVVWRPSSAHDLASFGATSLGAIGAKNMKKQRNHVFSGILHIVVALARSGPTIPHCQLSLVRCRYCPHRQAFTV